MFHFHGVFILNAAGRRWAHCHGDVRIAIGDAPVLCCSYRQLQKLERQYYAFLRLVCLSTYMYLFVCLSVYMYLFVYHEACNV